MGNRGSQDHLKDITERLEARVGKIPLSGRYHKTRKIEEDYAVQKKVLGSGYNGVVRLATSKHATLQTQTFAVKAFVLSSFANEKRRQLESEVEVFLCMDHPHITRLYDVYESADYLHLVMECMEGGELFDRVTEQKRFTERDAADAVWQMLLAVNYLHTHGIVHRDLKLENFLYDRKSSSHLKLIDFGFSKVWDPNMKMHMSCGTLSYVAPEVLKKCYTSQCDLWSLGVIAFILLAGYMPFSGAEAVQTKNISEGKYTMKPVRWNNVSKQAQDFVKALLIVDPEQRLSAAAALEHPWIVQRDQQASSEVDPLVVDALRAFGQASKFRRCCMEMMAWSLSNEERAKVRQHFISMDQNKQGTISLSELKKIMVEKFHVSDEETLQIFDAMDSNNDEEIHYSDFLAAMVSTRIALHDDLLKAAFKKFDTDGSGYITVENLREVLGETFEGEEVETLLQEADILQDGRISYAEFVAYLRNDPRAVHADATAKVIDSQIRKHPKESKAILFGVPLLTPRRTSKGSKGSDERPLVSQGKGKGSTTKAAVGGSSPQCCALM